MKQGDFSNLAENYAKYRSGYSDVVARALYAYVDAGRPGFSVAGVGAGTGILSIMMLEADLECVCVEPNDAMREEGIKHTEAFSPQWREGSGEETGLADGSVDWVTMASSFHWVKAEEGLKEFRRILKPGGHFTALWNPRNIEGNEFHEGIESMIYDMVPELERKSSGARKHVADMDTLLKSTGDFIDPLFMEASHAVLMSPERYLGAWRSVNDIQSQAGPERFEKIMAAIEARVAHLDQVSVPYLTRAWTATAAASDV